MSLDVRPQKTAAEEALATMFAQARDGLPGNEALATARAAAFRRFESQGLPTWRREEWKYTDLRAAMPQAQPLALRAGRLPSGAPGSPILPVDFGARRLVFSNGIFVPELSDLAELEPGLTIRPMGQALREGDALVRAHLTTHSVSAVPSYDPMQSSDAVQSFVADPAVTLNAALMSDGIVIHVAAGKTVERPIHLLMLSGEEAVSVFSRSLLVAESGARVMVLESHEGGAGHQVNTAFEMVVGDEAHVDHVKLNGGVGLHVASLLATIGGRVRFNTFVFTACCALVRNQMFLRFDGKGTLANIGGSSLLDGRQHVDNTLIADHASPDCQSREVFKTVLDGESRGVFQGKVIVRQKAQKTDARMVTRALLLSDEAEADHKPELEIFADDVQCGHGATTGSLDEELKFYLMARGIPKAEAEALLVQSFVGEAIDGIEHAGLRDALMEAVADWLKTRGERVDASRN